MRMSWLWECDLPRYRISDPSQALCTLMDRQVLFLSCARGDEEVSGYLGRKKRKGVRIGWLSRQCMGLLDFSSQGHQGDISTSSELKIQFSQFSSA